MATERKRPAHVRVMLSWVEKEELLKAAEEAGMGLSVFLRWAALEAARRRRLAV